MKTILKAALVTLIIVITLMAASCSKKAAFPGLDRKTPPPINDKMPRWMIDTSKVIRY